MKRSIWSVLVFPVAAMIWLAPNPNSTGKGNADRSGAGTTTVASRHRHAPAIIRERHGTSVTTGNWSGYAVAGPNGSVTDVTGSWIVPSVDCSVTPSADASLWVGIDGFSSNTVEQIGTDSDCVNGQPVYYAWYEFYPHWSYEINLKISPGDLILAEVSAGAKGTFTVTLADKTSLAPAFKTSQKMNNAAQSSAEWIVEAPWSGGILPLADFASAKFGYDNTTLLNTCYATVGGLLKGVSSPIGSFNLNYPNNVSKITMVGANGMTKASPSDLTTDGSSFTDAWASAGP